MDAHDEARYMPPPPGSLKALFRTIWMRAAYEVWRRTLRRELGACGPTTIVDCGCGSGELLVLLERWRPGDLLVGLDISHELVTTARSRTTDAQFVQASAQELPLRTASAGVVFALHVVEHLPEPELFIRDVARILRPGGLFVLATPNPAGIGARRAGRRWIGHSDPQHVSLASPAAWRGLLGAEGFVLSRDGTTGLSGIALFRKLPFALLNWIPLALFGFFPWTRGEAYIGIARKH